MLRSLVFAYVCILEVCAADPIASSSKKTVLEDEQLAPATLSLAPSATQSSEGPFGERLPRAEALRARNPDRAKDVEDLLRWNQTKDAESLNARISSYSGRHNGPNSQPFPTAKPLVGPYVEYEFTAANGDVWEKLGGSEEKLQQYVAEHPEETFVDSNGKLYGSGSIALSVSIQNTVDNSRRISETINNSIVNNSYTAGASVSINLGDTPINIVVNAPDAKRELPEERNSNSEAQEQQPQTQPRSEPAVSQITINNNISIDGNVTETGENAAPAQSSESAFLWLLKKIGLRKNESIVEPAAAKVLVDSDRKMAPNTRMLASVSEVSASTPNHLGWYGLAFALAVLVFAVRELQRNKFRFWLPVAVKRDKKEDSRHTKPSQGTRATSATRMHFRK